MERFCSDLIVDFQRLQVAILRRGVSAARSSPTTTWVSSTRRTTSTWPRTSILSPTTSIRCIFEKTAIRWPTRAARATLDLMRGITRSLLDHGAAGRAVGGDGQLHAAAGQLGCGPTRPSRGRRYHRLFPLAHLPLWHRAVLAWDPAAQRGGPAGATDRIKKRSASWRRSGPARDGGQGPRSHAWSYEQLWACRYSRITRLRLRDPPHTYYRSPVRGARSIDLISERADLSPYRLVIGR